MTIQAVNAEILSGSFTNDQLASIIDAVKFARARLSEVNKRSFKLGSAVRFTSTKNGVAYTGTVEKIAIKYITVRTAQGMWRVPASMLSLA